jgi:hypothetical protein
MFRQWLLTPGAVNGLRDYRLICSSSFNMSSAVVMTLAEAD